MKQYKLNTDDERKISELIRRPAINMERTFRIIEPILKDVKKKGLKSAVKYAERFDGFSAGSVFVDSSEIAEAEIRIGKKVKLALEEAYQNIRKFHAGEIPRSFEVETRPGVLCSREFRAIENAGLYIPGGLAVLPSTVLMLGIPAQLAGCKRIVLSTPVKGNSVNPVLLYAAALCGIKEIIKIGGAQGIALLAYGSREFRKVDKIFGPGSQYVTAAKMKVSIDPDGCAIDMPAGPSELLVISDSSANPVFIAADLLSQAEHGKDSQVVYITTSAGLADKVEKEIKKQLAVIPGKAIAAKSLENSFILIADNISDALYFSNRYAPEHLILHVKKPEQYRKMIINAGSVFLGEYSPESAGDYASGTNHSLPTSGYARSSGGVNVESFLRSVTFQSLTKSGLKRISSSIETLADTEGLFAHKNAVTVRLKK